MENEFSPKALVRSYSEKLATDVDRNGPRSDLQNILVSDYRQTQSLSAENAQWRQWYEQDAAIASDKLLGNVESRRLRDAWNKFLSYLPEEERAAIYLKNEPLDFDDIMNLMGGIEQRWESTRKSGKSGRINKYWKKCCVGIKAHETLFGILPEGSHYTSLFVGVLKSIINATANYENVAAFLSAAVEEINEIARRCTDVRKLYETKRMQQATLDLYARIFDFLSAVLEWYCERKSKRVLGSFNENLNSKFEEHLQSVRQVGTVIARDQWRMGISAEVRITRQSVERLVKFISHQEELSWQEKASRQRDLGTRIASVVKSQMQEMVEPLRQEIAQQLTIALRDKIPTPAPAPAPASDSLMLTDDGSRTLESSPMQPATTLQYSRDEILVASSHLEDHFDRNRLRIRYDPVRVSMPIEAASRLHPWIESKDSAILAVTAAHETRPQLLAPSSGLAASIVDFAADSRIPVVSYFCEVGTNEGNAWPSMVALVYALVRQVFEIFPTELQSAVDLSSERFAALDGSESSLNEAIRCLDDALDQGPNLLCCVIDGFQLLEDRTTVEALDGFLHILMCHRRQDLTLKVLITASARSRALEKHLSRDQLVLLRSGDRGGRGVRFERPAR